MHAQTAPAACDGTAHIIADPRTVTATSFFILVIDYTPFIRRHCSAETNSWSAYFPQAKTIRSVRHLFDPFAE
jgi:hypothetical protein